MPLAPTPSAAPQQAAARQRGQGYTIFWDIVSQLAYVIASKELLLMMRRISRVSLMLGGEYLRGNRPRGRQAVCSPSRTW